MELVRQLHARIRRNQDRLAELQGEIEKDGKMNIEINN